MASLKVEMQVPADADRIEVFPRFKILDFNSRTGEVFQRLGEEVYISNFERNFRINLPTSAR